MQGIRAFSVARPVPVLPALLRYGSPPLPQPTSRQVGSRGRRSDPTARGASTVRRSQPRKGVLSSHRSGHRIRMGSVRSAPTRSTWTGCRPAQVACGVCAINKPPMAGCGRRNHAEALLELGDALGGPTQLGGLLLAQRRVGELPDGPPRRQHLLDGPFAARGRPGQRWRWFARREHAHLCSNRQGEQQDVRVRLARSAFDVGHGRFERASLNRGGYKRYRTPRTRSMAMTTHRNQRSEIRRRMRRPSVAPMRMATMPAAP